MRGKGQLYALGYVGEEPHCWVSAIMVDVDCVMRRVSKVKHAWFD